MYVYRIQCVPCIQTSKIQKETRQTEPGPDQETTNSIQLPVTYNAGYAYASHVIDHHMTILFIVQHDTHSKFRSLYTAPFSLIIYLAILSPHL